MPDQQQQQRPPEPAPWTPKQGIENGPKAPDIKKPSTDELLKRMRRVEPEQSKRYRQRSGQ
jgi:hypothetical protein